MYYFNIINDNGARTGIGGDKTFFASQWQQQPCGGSPLHTGRPKIEYSVDRSVVRQGLFGSKIFSLWCRWMIFEYRTPVRFNRFWSLRLEYKIYYRNYRLLYTRRRVRNVGYDLFDIEFVFFVIWKSMQMSSFWRSRVKNDKGKDETAGYLLLIRKF